MAQVRQADANWSGDLLSGGGSVSASSSGIFDDQAITWRARTEASEGTTSPEELLAAAHASCYSMAVSNELAKAGFAPERVDVSVVVSADKTDAALERHHHARQGARHRRGPLHGAGQCGQGWLPHQPSHQRLGRDHARGHTRELTTLFDRGLDVSVT